MVRLEDFDICNLVIPYDKGDLVPFIGAGMSAPACRTWSGFVTKLRKAAKLPNLDNKVDTSKLHEPAQEAVAILRMHEDKDNFPKTIEKCLWVGENDEIPRQMNVLGSIHWPLVCTTNYDDLYCRSVKNQPNARPPCVLGRNQKDSIHILERMAFPEKRTLWALQGFLGSDFRCGCCENINNNLAKELVIGHSQYREATVNDIHFRRAFSHLFHTKSMLFLGSGLAEYYFRALFDEIIVSTGLPETPHYALIKENSNIDTNFLYRQYHILCITYNDHKDVCCALKKLKHCIESKRTAINCWGYRLDINPKELIPDHSNAQFEVVTAALPKVSKINGTDQNSCGEKLLQKCDVIAISAGRGYDDNPIFSTPTCNSIGITTAPKGQLNKDDYYLMHEDLKTKYSPSICSIAARVLGEGDSRDFDSVYKAFKSFLCGMQESSQFKNCDYIPTLHVQLLAAGPGKNFPPWVSLIQMARAYGDFVCCIGHENVIFKVKVYIVDPSVALLMRSGKLDLAAELKRQNLEFKVEIIGQSIDAKFFYRCKHHKRIGDIASELELGFDDIGAVQVLARPSSRPVGWGKDFLQDMKIEKVGTHVVSGGVLTFIINNPAQ